MRESKVGIVVGAIFVYPVKSCRAVTVRSAALERRGLPHDRRWMIVDEAGRFLTQRTEPRLALVDVAVETTALLLAAPGAPSLRVPHAAVGGTRRRVQVWRDEVVAVDCGEAAAAWTSAWLGRRTALVFMPDDVERRVNPKYAQPRDIVGFADGFPFLLASASSLDDVNGRLQKPVPMERFRPNIVVEGSEPWAEDHWKRIRIGSVAVLGVAKPCERCAITTVDQRTAESGVEPLRTLATFRRVGNNVLFAQNCLLESPGTIAMGDQVTVLS